MNVAEIKEHTLAATPCYLFRGALKLMEARGAASVVNALAGRKPKTYPDEQLANIYLQFANPSSWAEIVETSEKAQSV